MRNPYITGGWVVGHEHYGRKPLIQHILESPNDAVWVVGNRRSGKTSLLRQLEYLTAESDTYLPLFWDMQGSPNLTELGAELVYVIEDEFERFVPLEPELELLRGQDATEILRQLRRYARAAGRTLLLLCDEAEALLQIARDDPNGLMRLRRVLLSNNGLRVVMTSTKILSQVNELNQNWQTSPFLFGFGLRNLKGLADEAALALIRHSQDPEPVQVTDDLAQQISFLTGNHPYLIQILCSRLFTEEGSLRNIEPQDLMLDSTLQDYLRNDFRWLSPGERQVLLSIAAGNDTVEAVATDTDLALQAVQEFVYSHERLGSVRLVTDPEADSRPSDEAGGILIGDETNLRLLAGNDFLQRWLQQNHQELLDEAQSGEIGDDTTRELIRQGQEEEARYLIEQLRIQRANLGELEIQRARFGPRVPLDLVNDIKRVKIEIQQLEERLALILPEIVSHAHAEVLDSVEEQEEEA